MWLTFARTLNLLTQSHFTIDSSSLLIHQFQRVFIMHHLILSQKNVISIVFSLKLQSTKHRTTVIAWPTYCSVGTSQLYACVVIYAMNWDACHMSHYYKLRTLFSFTLHLIKARACVRVSILLMNDFTFGRIILWSN